MYRFLVRCSAGALAAITTVVLSGCAGTPDACAASSSLQCLAREARQPHIDACMDDLFWYRHRSRYEKSIIDARYQYPVTSADTYFDLQRMGVGAPSPREWCAQYARRVTALTFRP